MSVRTFSALAGSGFLFLATQAESALVSHWPLTDGAAGSAATTANDAIGVANGSGLSGATWEFDATRNRIVLEKDDSDRLEAGTQNIDLANRGFTWSTWVEIDSTNLTDSGADVILGSRNGSWNKVQPTGTQRFFDIGGYSIADDNWHHLTYVGTPVPNLKGEIFIDGVSVGSDTTTFNNVLVENTKFEIGGSDRFGEDTSGRYSDVGVWDEDLSTDEVFGLFDVGNETSLLYDASQFDLLKQVHDAGSGSVVIGGLEWTYVPVLPGAAGLSGGGGLFDLVLDSTAGTGLSVLPIPEPSRALLLVLGALGLILRRRR